jgi:hypothetical protein
MEPGNQTKGRNLFGIQIFPYVWRTEKGKEKEGLNCRSGSLDRSFCH